tara:strand:- start:340 stop:777 length:438 start_codon:yes stop_codon:yes gene_type:complete
MENNSKKSYRYKTPRQAYGLSKETRGFKAQKVKSIFASMSMNAKSTLICDSSKPSNLYRLTSLEINGRNTDGQTVSYSLDRNALEAICKDLGLRTSWKHRKSVENVFDKIADKYQDSIAKELNRKSSCSVFELKFDKDLTLLNRN